MTDNNMRHGANYRPIEQGDIESCTRGLQLGTKTPAELRALIATHAKVDMFASAVIVVAAAAQLAPINEPMLTRFTDDELRAMRRTPNEKFRAEIDKQIARQAAIDALRARRAARGDADPLTRLRHHVTGAIERGEGVAIEGIPARTCTSRFPNETHDRDGKIRNCHFCDEPSPAVFLAPQQKAVGEPWVNIPVCACHADGWWDGSDYPGGVGAPPIVKIYSDG